MSRIKSLYREYFQKSRVFLYPVLDIKRGNSIIPLNTYIACEGLGIEPKDGKLITVYQYRTDHEYQVFENEKLKGNKLFEKLVLINNRSEIVYIFNFGVFSKDWEYVIAGKYSKLSIPFKRKIKDFFRQSGNNYVYIESFLHPEKYFALYSELLNVQMHTLKEVGELCSPPEIEKETLLAETFELTDKTKQSHDQPT